MKGTLILCSMGFLLALGSALWLLGRRPAQPQTRSFAVTALTDDGQPVVGAEVYLQQELVGITDSYGQWKKVYSLPAAQVIHLRVEKTVSNGRLLGVKNLVTTEQNAEELSATLTLDAQPQQPGMWIQLDAGSASSERRQYYRWMEKTLLPALTNEARSRQIQLEATSPWQMLVSPIAISDPTPTPTLLRIQVRDQGSSPQIDFLVSALGPVPKIAKDIFAKVRFQQQQQFLSKGWTKYQLRLRGELPQGARVFVAGIKAVSLGKQTWEYWGRPDQAANLSVIDDGRVIFRRRMIVGRDAELIR